MCYLDWLDFLAIGLAIVMINFGIYTFAYWRGRDEGRRLLGKAMETGWTEWTNRDETMEELREELGR